MTKQHSVFSRLRATRTDVTEATFDWQLNETSKHLLVTCRYGGGNDASNRAIARIPYDSLEPVPIEPEQQNPKIVVHGNVSVLWFKDGYVVFFEGDMSRPNVVRVSADPAIVGASLRGDIALAASKQ